jgi:hypothetical protein
MEYLKNVVLKFLSFSSNQEREQLLPVLSTMLKLSADEQNLIMNAKGISDNLIFVKSITQFLFKVNVAYL